MICKICLVNVCKYSSYANLIQTVMLQFEFGLAVLLLSPVVCSIMAFLQSLQAEEMAMTSKPRKVVIIGCHRFQLSKGLNLSLILEMI